MEKCPFCGAKPEEAYGMEPQFKCGSERWNEVNPYRSPKCYERQLATLQAQVAGMRELLQGIKAELIHTFDIPVDSTDEALSFGEWLGFKDTIKLIDDALLSTPTAGEWVIITKTDAYTAMQWAEKYGFLPMANRLKAALGTTGEEE